MTPPLRALLVDDEGPARKQFRILLRAHPEVEIVGEAECVREAAELAQRTNPDVIFLDIQMPEASGFDLLLHLESRPMIVFVTAHDEFAVGAFDAHAFDYLLKPVHPRRLASTIERLRASSVPNIGATSSQLCPDDLVTLRNGVTTCVVLVRDIGWIEAEGAYTRVQLEKGRHMLVLRSIGEWEEKLPGKFFSRLDRSLIVNLGWVTDVNVFNRNITCVKFRSVDTPLKIGRTASTKLKASLKIFTN